MSHQFIVDSGAELDNAEVKILFVVDDLDRCRPQTAYAVLSGIKTFFGIPSVLCLVAYDEDILSEYLRVTLPNEIRKDRSELEQSWETLGHMCPVQSFQEKVFQAEFELPSSKDRIEALIKGKIRSAEVADGLKEILVSKGNLIAQCCQYNPRRVIRTINHLLLSAEYRKLSSRSGKLEYEQYLNYFSGSLAQSLCQLVFPHDVFLLVRDENWLANWLANIAPFDGEVFSVKDIARLRQLANGSSRRKKAIVKIQELPGRLPILNQLLSEPSGLFRSWLGADKETRRKIRECLTQPAYGSEYVGDEGQFLRNELVQSMRDEVIHQSKVSEEGFKIDMIVEILDLNVAGLRLKKAMDWGALSLAPRLRNLYLQEGNIQSLKHLLRLKELRFLDVSKTKVKNLKPIAQLPKIEHLVADNCAIADLSPLLALPSLGKLSVQNCSKLRLEEIAKFQKEWSIGKEGNQGQKLELEYTSPKTGKICETLQRGLSH